MCGVGCNTWLHICLLEDFILGSNPKNKDCHLKEYYYLVGAKLLVANSITNLVKVDENKDVIYKYCNELLLLSIRIVWVLLRFSGILLCAICPFTMVAMWHILHNFIGKKTFKSSRQMNTNKFILCGFPCNWTSFKTLEIWWPFRNANLNSKPYVLIRIYSFNSL
jgi:hypothetical protein